MNSWGSIFCFLVVFGPFVSPQGLVGRPWAAGGRILGRPTEGGRQLGLEQKKSSQLLSLADRFEYLCTDGGYLIAVLVTLRLRYDFQGLVAKRVWSVDERSGLSP